MNEVFSLCGMSLFLSLTDLWNDDGLLQLDLECHLLMLFWYWNWCYRITFSIIIIVNIIIIFEYYSTLSYIFVLKLELLKELNGVLVEMAPGSFEDCVTWARKKFQENYTNQIHQLLHVYPPDHVSKTGAPFWSGPKRCPTPLVFDEKDVSINIECPPRLWHLGKTFEQNMFVKQLPSFSWYHDKVKVLTFRFSHHLWVFGMTFTLHQLYK